MGPKLYKKVATKSKKTAFVSNTPVLSNKIIYSNVSSDASYSSYLVIVESPSKCAKIEEYLGQQYQCIASKGHIREITGLKDIDIENNYTPKFTIIKEKEDHVKWMRSIIKEYPKDRVLIATDDDREGEGIAWHIYQLFDLPTNIDNRIVFHEITKPAIHEAIRCPRRLDMQLVKAQQARQVLDIIVGFRISPFLWKHIQQSSKGHALSAGRCQTPALRLIYDNEKLCRESEPELIYKTRGVFSSLTLDFTLNRDFENIEEIEGFLKESKDFHHILDIGKEKRVIKKVPKPFNTSRLLQVASSILRSSPKQTMQTCQELYQNGYITYMRTENTKYSSLFLDIAKRYIEKEYDEPGKKTYVGEIQNITNNDPANPHEAIRCTNINLKDISSELASNNPRMISMYALIWRNTVESCMSDAEYKNHCASISAPYETTYEKILEIPSFLGWKKVGIQEKNIDSDSSTLFFLQSQIGKRIDYTLIESKIHIKGKKTHYTEAGLIQELEDLGIGRPSTFSLLVDTVQDRGYVKCTDIPGIEKECTEFILRQNGVLDKQIVKKELGGEKQKLRIQPVGILCIEFLIKYFDSLFSYDYTSSMEDKLDAIAKIVIDGNGYDDNENSNICKECDREISKLSKNLSSMKRQEINIDESHVFVMTTKGPAIRCKKDKDSQNEKKSEYLSIKSGLEIDIDKLKRGEYSLEELVQKKNQDLGVYKGFSVHVKTGKYGPYLEWNGENTSIKSLDKPRDEITLQDAIDFLETHKIKEHNKESEESNELTTRGPAKTQKSILRIIDTDTSIRRGKFGPYIFYKTSEMRSPKFITLKGFTGNWANCSPNTIISLVKSHI